MPQHISNVMDMHHDRFCSWLVDGAQELIVRSGASARPGGRRSSRHFRTLREGGVPCHG